MVARGDEILLIQYVGPHGEHRCGILAGRQVRRLVDHGSSYDLIRTARRSDGPLGDFVRAARLGEAEPIDLLETAGRLRPPLTHPEPARCLIAGTGLTHRGSMEPRDAMHQGEQDKETDSAKMFRWGVEGGRPAGDGPGVAPEWFFKGDGTILAAPGADLLSPAFGERGGEEFEIAMIYLIDEDGTPLRIGCALGNEFSDHVIEAKNYLYLAHSKLRPCAIGPALRLGTLPDEVSGAARIVRAERTVWQQPFLSGAAHMNHTLENLEYHHFKYAPFRRPGDIHIYFVGAAVLSWADGFMTEPGDMFELEAEGFGAPLRNRLKVADPDFAYDQVRMA